MARTSAIAKEATKKKFGVRYHSRCKRCGRPRGFMRKVPALPNLFPAVVALGRSSRSHQVELVVVAKKRERI